MEALIVLSIALSIIFLIIVPAFIHYRSAILRSVRFVETGSWQNSSVKTIAKNINRLKSSINNPFLALKKHDHAITKALSYLGSQPNWHVWEDEAKRLEARKAIWSSF